MNDILSIITLAISVISAIIVIVVLVKINALAKSNNFKEYEDAVEKDLSNHRNEINQRLDGMNNSVSERLNLGLNSIVTSEYENIKNFKEEVGTRLSEFSKSVTESNRSMDARMEEMRKSQDEKLESLRKSQESKLDALIESQANRLYSLSDRQDAKLEQLREITEKKLNEIKDTNQKKLDEIEGTVAEKLDKTLAARVSESFKNVSEQLEQVYKGLGEMKSLAADVGGLKNALTNVKTRGEIGEIQLSRILEQTLTREQYDENVITKKGSRDPVEFAIKLPSKDSDVKFIYLPVDAKFPLDTYSALCKAYEEGDKTAIEIARKALNERVKTDAKNICEKYISVPDTTDFGIMFLPTEGLFAEITRNVELTEKIRNDYKVTVCGPSTITAFLNSLQMGFRTLTYEKKSGEIARTLSEVKTEFGKFGDSLKKVQKSIATTGTELDNLVGTRTRAINRKLSKIEQLPAGEAYKFLDVNEGAEE